jgi:hypothetical protein
MSREGRRGCTGGASVRERVKRECAECMGVRDREQGLCRRYGCQENGKGEMLEEWVSKVRRYE